MNTLEKALRFPFEQKNWENKLAMLFLVFFAVSLVSTLSGNGGSQEFKQMLSQNFANGSFETNIRPIIDSVHIFRTGWYVFLQLLFIPVQFYISGYMFSLTSNVMKKKEDILDEPTSIMNHLKLGWNKFVLTLPSIFVSLFFIFVTVTALVLINSSRTDFTVGPYTPTAVLSIIVFLLINLVFGVFVYLANTSIYYNFLKTGSYSKAFNWGQIMKTISAGWVDYFKVVGVAILIGIVTAVISVALCCLSFIVAPALSLYTALVMAYLYGHVYKKLAANKI